MNPACCLNCYHPIAPDQSFCGHCGQQSSTQRLYLKHIVHEFFHAFTHTDKGFLLLIKSMAMRPGKVVHDYIAGQRKKYFNPFSFLVITVALATLMTSYFDLLAPQGERMNPVTAFMNEHMNLVVFFNVPVYALFSWLLFRQKGYNFAEHLVLAAFTSGERSVFFCLVMAPMWIILPHLYYYTLSAYLAAWFIYYGWACAQLFPGNRAWNFAKGLIVSLLVQLIFTALVTAVIMIYTEMGKGG